MKRKKIKMRSKFFLRNHLEHSMIVNCETQIQLLICKITYSVYKRAVYLYYTLTHLTR